MEFNHSILESIFRMQCLSLLLLLSMVTMATCDNFTMTPFPIASSSYPSSSVSPPATQTVPSPTLSPSLPACHQKVDALNRTCVKICIYQTNVTTSTNATIKWTTKLIKARSGAVSVDGSCPATHKDGLFNESAISLKWSEAGHEYNLSFSFRFNLKQNGKGLNSAVNAWYLSAVRFLNGSATYATDTSKNDTISATSAKAYFCPRELSLNLSATPATKGDTYATLHFANYTIQAFAFNDTKYEFGDTINCVSTALPSYIPIIVGCALAGLVLLVLVVYIIARCWHGKQQQQDGYERLS